LLLGRRSSCVFQHLVSDVHAEHLGPGEALGNDARRPARAGGKIEDAFPRSRREPLYRVLDGIGDAAADLVVTTAGRVPNRLRPGVV
jgi:hypothetical protein